MTLFTIGHGALPIAEFIGLLREHGIRHVVDVRSEPYSRFAPQYNRADLASSLADHGIEYTFLGQALGGRPRDPTCYRKRALPDAETDYLKEVDYAAVMAKPWFRQGIEQLLDVAARAPTAILCSEGDPLQCHRHHLIATYINREFPEVDVQHIVPGGTFSSRGRGSVADEPTVTQGTLF